MNSWDVSFSIMMYIIAVLLLFFVSFEVAVMWLASVYLGLEEKK